MKHHKLFNDKSDLYAKVRPRYPKDLFAFLASLCNEQKNAWDVACGNGQAALDLAKDFAEIHATDVSEQQISNAIPNPRVRYSVQAAEKTNFAENQFDLVAVAQALHWFDYDLFWPEIKRVLKPNGIFAAWGYSWFLAEDINNALQKEFFPAIKPYWAKQNQILWNKYRDIPFPFEKIDAPEFEMKMDWNLDQLFSCLQTWSSVRQYLQKDGDEELLMRSYERLQSVWGDAKEKKSIQMDFVVLVGRNK
ncbi:MAG: class I SAM-dependent methyltransferase [Chloroflexi bacterium]|nr:class I SAM-dependent methyltransferase [Chloroflexota bacterium]